MHQASVTQIHQNAAALSFNLEKNGDYNLSFNEETHISITKPKHFTTKTNTSLQIHLL